MKRINTIHWAIIDDEDSLIQEQVEKEEIKFEDDDENVEEEKKPVVKKTKAKPVKIKGGDNFVRTNLKRGYKPAWSAAWTFKMQNTWKRNQNYKIFHQDLNFDEIPLACGGLGK